MLQNTPENNLNFIPLKRFYLSDDRLDPQKIFHRIQMGKKCSFLYLIALSGRDGELFVIYPAKELLLPIYKNRTIEICGIAKGEKNAIRLIEQIISDVYTERNEINVDLFFHT